MPDERVMLQLWDACSDIGDMKSELVVLGDDFCYRPEVLEELESLLDRALVACRELQGRG